MITTRTLLAAAAALTLGACGTSAESGVELDGPAIDGRAEARSPSEETEPDPRATTLPSASAGELPAQGSQDIVGFAPRADSGYVRTDLTTSHQPVVPNLGYEQYVFQSESGSTASLSISSSANEYEPQVGSSTISAGVAAGFVAVGHEYVDVLVRGDAAESDRDAVIRASEQALATVSDRLAELGVPSVDDEGRGVAGERARLAGDTIGARLASDRMSLIDDRGRHENESADTTTVRYSSGDRAIAVTWRPVGPTLSLEVAAGPLATDFVASGDRLYATVPSYTGEPARASWIQAGFFVTVSAGNTPDEAEQVASQIEPADADRMQADASAAQAALEAAPVVSEHRSQAVAGDAELALVADGQVLCWAADAPRACKKADLLGTGSWFEAGDGIVVVGAYPTDSDPVRVEINGVVVRTVTANGYDWIVESIDRGTELSFSLTVGDVPAQTVTVTPG